MQAPELRSSPRAIGSTRSGSTVTEHDDRGADRVVPHQDHYDAYNRHNYRNLSLCGRCSSCDRMVPSDLRLSHHLPAGGSTPRAASGTGPGSSALQRKGFAEENNNAGRRPSSTRWLRLRAYRFRPAEAGQMHLLMHGVAIESRGHWGENDKNLYFRDATVMPSS